ncbi:tetratricopeptide repeat protein, partial [Salmonella enterica subsp. enterica serovar Enteritidis]|nr:tetratricopeptide repeat protein [Salmonella enterica subsp. enterica serovar Enteritidis]
VEEGRTRFNRGIELYKEGNFHAALAEFRAAYAAAPSYRIHYNLGQTLYQLQDYAGAVRAFEQYLAEGGDKIEADRKKEVDADLAKLRPRVAKLVFVVNVPAAEVSVDDEPRGQA